MLMLIQLPPPSRQSRLRLVFAACCGTLLASANARDSSPINAVESRLVSDAELQDYVQRVAASLPMATRERDPFGTYQDPEVAKAAVPVARETTPTHRAATPLSDIIGAISIGAIMPAEKRFLVGSRTIRLNQEFSVTFSGRPYRLRAEEIGSRRILFRNIENDETASRDFNTMPSGMRRGGNGGGTGVPGMSSSSPDAPIQLDP